MKKLSAICIILTLFWVGCEDSIEPDTTPPSILITNPADNATLTATIIIKVSATDDDAVEKVSFFVDGDSIGVSTTSPFEFEWRVAFWADGNAHSIFAKATDKSGNVGTSDVISVTISKDAAALMGLSPTEDEIIRYTDQPALKWRALLGAISYATEVSSDSLFSLVEFSATVTDTSDTTTSLTQGSHYWRVRAQNETEVWSEWSDVNKFSIEGPLPPVMQSPEDGSVSRDANISTLLWSSSEFAESYEVSIASSFDFSNVEFSDSTSDTTITTTALTQGSHYWRVRSQNGVNIWGDWTSGRSFRFDGPLPPNLVSPPNDTLIIENNTPTIVWNSSTFAVSYDLNVSSSSDFSAVEFTGIFTDTTVTSSVLWKNGTYYWRVRAQNSVEFWGDWSSSSTFLLSDVIIFAKIFDFRTDERDIGNSVHQTADGGYIITGTAEAIENSVLLIKTNAQGNEEWIRSFFNLGFTNGNSGHQTVDGGYIIVGSTFSNDFGYSDVIGHLFRL